LGVVGEGGHAHEAANSRPDRWRGAARGEEPGKLGLREPGLLDFIRDIDLDVDLGGQLVARCDGATLELLEETGRIERVEHIDDAEDALRLVSLEVSDEVHARIRNALKDGRARLELLDAVLSEIADAKRGERADHLLVDVLRDDDDPHPRRVVAASLGRSHDPLPALLELARESSFAVRQIAKPEELSRRHDPLSFATSD